MSKQGVKVAYITSVDSTVHYILLNQILYLKREGYEVHAVCSKGPLMGEIESRGIPVFTIEIQRRISPLADLRALWQLYRLFLRERYTIVHTHTPKPGLLGQLAARMAHVPIVVNTVHGFYFHDHMNRWARAFFIALAKIAAFCSDKILSVNSEDIATAIKEGICPSWKIEYLGNGIDLTTFDPQRFSDADVARSRQELRAPHDVGIVGFVGRLAAKRKGFCDFLSAARCVLERLPDIRFLIIGEADHGKPDAVEPSVAVDYGIAEHCVFLGQRPNYELPLLYRTMNVLVLPSLFEGMPRAVMEASAMQVPAVVTDVKGNREAIEHGRNGLLVPLGDVQALAEAMVELLTDREKARRMGEEGRRIALQRFDEYRVFDKVRDEYERLLREKGLVGPTRAPSMISDQVA